MVKSLKKLLTGWMVMLGLCLSQIGFGQTGAITGKITDNTTGELIPFASVFLSNSSIGTQSNADGEYQLKSIKPGQYELVVKYLGYESFHHLVVIEPKVQTLNIKIIPKATQLNTVVIRPDVHRDRNLGIFKREFIGNSEAASKFKILNPSVLTITYDEGKQLEASSDEFLILENKYLGYRIKYLLKEFKLTYMPFSYGAGMLYYEGVSLFENLTAGKAQMKRWKKNRLNTYLGSSTHFHRAIRQNSLQREKFSMYQLIRKENRDRPSDNLINAKLVEWRNKTGIASNLKADTVDYWLAKKGMPRQIQYLLKDSLQRNKVFFNTDRPELFALSFQDHLYVTYKGSREVNMDVYRPLNDPDAAEASIVSKTSPYVFFDKNGTVTNPRSVIFEGVWVAKIPFLLPYDYEPGD